jgi:hypothetical protein
VIKTIIVTLINVAVFELDVLAPAAGSCATMTLGGGDFGDEFGSVV